MKDSETLTLEAWRSRGSAFTYQGHDVFYVDEGSGDALVCIHGFPTASWDWAWIWEDLTSRFRVVAPDMMGFGFTAKPRNYTYSLKDQATLHQSLLAELGITRAHFLCHDYGDTVGQELLARDAEGKLDFEIRSMCFLNGGIIPGEHRPRVMQRLLISPLGFLVGRLMSEKRFNASFSEIFGADSKPSPEELHDFWTLVAHNDGPRVAHKLIRYMRERIQNKDRWVGALQNTAAPIRFVNGPDDPVSGRHMADMYSELVPNPDVVLLDGIGHYPQVEAPKATLSAFWEFIARA
jgi:pimeloyl-ACP methyl ester carboxylesterase